MRTSARFLEVRRGCDNRIRWRAFLDNGMAVTPRVSTFVNAIEPTNQNPDQRPNYCYVAKSQRVSLRLISSVPLGVIEVNTEI